MEEQEINREALRIANQHTSPLQANQLALEITQYGDRMLEKVFRHQFAVGNPPGEDEWEERYQEWKKEQTQEIGI